MKRLPKPTKKAIVEMRNGLTLAGIQACVRSLFANIGQLTEADEAELMKIYNDIRRVSGRAVGIDTDAEDAANAKLLGLKP